MPTIREYDVVDNFKFVAKFKTLQEAKDFIEEFAQGCDIMTVDTPIGDKYGKDPNIY